MQRKTSGLLIISNLRIVGWGAILILATGALDSAYAKIPSAEDLGRPIPNSRSSTGFLSEPAPLAGSRVIRSDEMLGGRLSLDSMLEDRTAGSPMLAHQGPSRPPQREGWCWQRMPGGLLYQSYMAGVKEPRLAVKWLYEKNEGWMLDTTLGGRVGLLRYGTTDRLRARGWQLDAEGAAQPRIDPEVSSDLTSTDFRVGAPITYSRGAYQMKVAWYHLSSHLGDEFMLKNPGVPRINYSRDAFVWGHSFYPNDNIRLYAEVEWAYYTDGGTKPWEFQFGMDYYDFKAAGEKLVPFFAVNGHIRESVDFGGNLSLQAGLLFRGASGRLFRAGLHYYAGKSDQYEFFDRYEDKIGFGLWYDF